MLNGIEAMRDTSGELSIKSQLTDDGQLLISVTDTGVGLPTENVDQIFNAILYHQVQRHRLGTGNCPFHRRIARWPYLGGSEFRTGRNVLLHAAQQSGGGCMSRRCSYCFHCR